MITDRMIYDAAIDLADALIHDDDRASIHLAKLFLAADERSSHSLGLFFRFLGGISSSDLCGKSVGKLTARVRGAFEREYGQVKDGDWGHYLKLDIWLRKEAS